MGELGKRLGHLERCDPARRRSDAARGDHRARRRALPYQPGLGAFLSNAHVRCLRQPLAARRPDTVWTIVNRNEFDVTGRQMTVPAQDGVRYFDLYHGVELTPEREGERSRPFVFRRGPRIWALSSPFTVHPTPSINELMSRMKKMTATPLSSYSHEWKRLAQQLVRDSDHQAAAAAPEGMVRIPAATMSSKCRELKSKDQTTLVSTCSTRGRTAPRRFHEHRMQVKPFIIDKYPVTNAEFKKFLDATHYHPQDDLNFLRLEEWHLSRRLGQKACDVGIARGCARLREVGGQAAAPRVGVAICRPGHDETAFIPGEIPGTRRMFPCPIRDVL